MKKVPHVFANKVDKKMTNNNTYYKSGMVIRNDSLSVRDKIENLFNSTNYVYKVDVEISYKDKKETKRIVGKNDKYLITIDNEKIPIEDIINIDYKK